MTGDRSLRNVKFRTVLIFPQTERLGCHIPPLGIPQLRAYLNHRGYDKIDVVDLASNPNISFSTLMARGINRHLLNSAPLNNLVQRTGSVGSKGFRTINSILEARIRSEYDPGRIHIPWNLGSMVYLAFRKSYPDSYNCYLQGLLSKEDIGLVGFSVMYPRQLFHALMIARMVKSIHDDAFVVLGGPQIIKNIKILTSRIDIQRLVDGFVLGDGEEALSGLIYELAHSREFDAVPNLLYRDGKGGYIRSICGESYDSDEMLTPDFKGFSFTMLPIRASHGCLWGRCSFCTYCLVDRDYGVSDARKVVKTIERLRDTHGIRRFRFVDDCLHPDFLHSLAETLIRRKTGIMWQCSLSLVPGYSRDLVSMLARSGCRRIVFGIESMSPRVLEMMMKPQTTEYALEVLGLFRNSGIDVRIGIIFGFPGETLEEAEKTLDFLKHRPQLYDSVCIQQFCLEEGTIVFDEPHRFGITNIHKKKDSGDSGIRLGYPFEVEEGMDQEESRSFTQKALEHMRSLGKLKPGDVF